MLDASKLLEAIGGDKVPVPDQNIIERLRFDDRFDVPIELTDAEMWGNYVNEDLYVMDKKVREFLKRTTRRRRNNGGYRTTASLVFAWIYGRQPQPPDGAAMRMLHALMRYYCTTYTGTTTYNGKRVSHVYKFSKYAFEHRRPYSLKLRLEEMDEGSNPWRQSPVDDSKKRLHGRREHCEAGRNANG